MADAGRRPGKPRDWRHDRPAVVAVGEQPWPWRQQQQHQQQHRPPPSRGTTLASLDAPAEARGGGGLLDKALCRALCTARACCQQLQLLLCMLIVICSSVSYNSTGGYTGLFSLGSIYYYQYGGAYSGLSGADGEKAQQLDAQFHQLKVPPAQVAMAVGGALMAFACFQIVASLFRVPWHCPAWLIAEAILDVAIAIGLVPALYFYYHRLHEIYASSLCKERENLYQSKGYRGFGCSLHGAEIAVGFFAGAAIVAFAVAVVLAVRGFKIVRTLQAKPSSHSYEP
uniref:MARVEL domain containing 3 n=2 Tax=Podarcis muralis TaxID=64176 RepID=A0A670ILS9_PODMU